MEIGAINALFIIHLTFKMTIVKWQKVSYQNHRVDITVELWQ